MEFVYLAAGLVLLILSGDFLVKGAVALSLSLGVPALIVSVTIVGFGTSAPELLVAVKAALNGAPGLALGNVIGSNIANVLLVLGVPALIYALRSTDSDTINVYLMMMAASVIFTALAFAGPLYFAHGVVLLALLAVMLGHSFLRAKNCNIDDDLDSSALPKWKIWLFIIAGIIGLPIGAQLMVEGGLTIAQRFGIPEAVIGLTLIAIGTSLPELATTVVAAIRRQSDVALGNVIGSNMFNLLAIMGITSFFGPLNVSDEFLRFDLWVMLATSALLGLFVFTKLSITRIWGVAFLLLYVVYLIKLLG